MNKLYEKHPRLVAASAALVLGVGGIATGIAVSSPEKAVPTVTQSAITKGRLALINNVAGFLKSEKKGNYFWVSPADSKDGLGEKFVRVLSNGDYAHVSLWYSDSMKNGEPDLASVSRIDLGIEGHVAFNTIDAIHLYRDGQEAWSGSHETTKSLNKSSNESIILTHHVDIRGPKGTKDDKYDVSIAVDEYDITTVAKGDSGSDSRGPISEKTDLMTVRAGLLNLEVKAGQLLDTIRAAH